MTLWASLWHHVLLASKPVHLFYFDGMLCALLCICFVCIAFPDAHCSLQLAKGMLSLLSGDGYNGMCQSHQKGKSITAIIINSGIDISATKRASTTSGLWP